MDKCKELIDTFISNYSSYHNGKVVTECDYCELIFYKGARDVLTLYGIYIFPEHREKGLCRNILQYLIDIGISSRFKQLCIQSVLSNVLYDYLCRFEYKKGRFTKRKDGFFYTLK